MKSKHSQGFHLLTRHQLIFDIDQIVKAREYVCALQSMVHASSSLIFFVVVVDEKKLRQRIVSMIEQGHHYEDTSSKYHPQPDRQNNQRYTAS